MKLIFVFTFLWILFPLSSLLADSPLTSTGFSSAYQNEAIVQQAGQAEGLLNLELLEYLSGDHPIEIKMAVINQLGWSIDGKSNASIYVDYLQRLKNYKDEKELMKKGSADELLCVAYLKALDNYFKVDDALHFAELAVKKNSTSFTFRIIHAIIKAQKAMENDWCAVFKATDAVRNDSSLNGDMRVEAIAVIFEYMDLYREYCK